RVRRSLATAHLYPRKPQTATPRPPLAAQRHSCCHEQMTTRPTELRIIPIRCADEIHPGNSVSDKLFQSLKTARQGLRAGDILAIKHKIISKAEGQIIDLTTIRPSASTRAWARKHRLDPRVTDLAILQAQT